MRRVTIDQLPERQLAACVRAFSQAYRLRLAVRRGFQFLIVATIGDVVLLASIKLGPVAHSHLWLAAVPLALVPAAMLWAMLRIPESRLVALDADRTLGLRERLVTAIELRQERATGHFRDLQLADLLARVERVKPRQAFPIRLRRQEILLLAIPLAVLLSLIIGVQPQAQPAPEARKLQQVVKQEAERVNAIADAVEAEAVDESIASAAAKALRTAGEELERDPRSVEAALAALSAAQERLLGLQAQHAGDLEQAMARAAQALQQQAETSAAGSQLARGDVDAAAESLRELANKQNEMDQSRRGDIAKALKAAASSADAAAPALGRSLRDAAAALEANAPQVEAALKRAAGDLRQAGADAAMASRLDQAVAELESSKSNIEQSDPQTQSTGSTPARGEGEGEGQGRDTAPSSREGSRAAGELAADDTQPAGQGAGKGTLERTTDVFAPESLGARPELDASPEMDHPSVAPSDRAGGPMQNEALVDYREVLANYRDSATAATQDRYIPLDLRNVVRDYFSSLEPQR